MTKHSKSRPATFEDLRAARLRSAEVLGLAADGEPMTVHWLAMPASKVLEYLDREDDKDMPLGQKYRKSVADLAETLVDAEGEPLATEEQLMELPADTINVLIKTVAGVKDKEGDEGNVSGEADGSASPTA